jgi:type IX secretion system PorP/SprF family membrane protein
MKSCFLTSLTFFLILSALSAQNSRIVPPQEIPNQNLLRYNTYFMNPTFSRVGVKNSYVSLYSRKQWVQFEDAPNIYMLNYTMRVDNNTGVGLGVQQQSNGILNYFGVNANYSYGVQLSEKSWLSAGANLTYFSSGLKSNVATAVDDPLIRDFEEATSITFRPGINLSISNFDIGFYAENLVSYDLRTERDAVTPQIFSGHVMYTQPLGKSDQNLFRGMMRVRRNELENIILSGNLLYDVSDLGWVQAGYDDFYGGSVGLGIEITPNISIGYTLEKGFNDTTSNLGVTHEFTLVYQFRDLAGQVAVNDGNQDEFYANDIIEKEALEQAIAGTELQEELTNESIRQLREEQSLNLDIITELRNEIKRLQRNLQPSLENQNKLQIALQKLTDHQETNPTTTTPQYINNSLDTTPITRQAPYNENASEDAQSNSNYRASDATSTVPQVELHKALTDQNTAFDEEILVLLDEKEVIQSIPTPSPKEQQARMEEGTAVSRYINREAQTNSETVSTTESLKKQEINDTYGITNLSDTVNGVKSSSILTSKYEQKGKVHEVLIDSELENILTASNEPVASTGNAPTTIQNLKPSKTSNNPQTVDSTDDINSFSESRYSQAEAGSNEPIVKSTETSFRYYIVGNAFKEHRNATAFLEYLAKSGFSQSQILPIHEKSMEFVTIASYTTEKEALDAMRSKMSGQYVGDMWIYSTQQSMHQYNALSSKNLAVNNSSANAISTGEVTNAQKNKGNNAFAKANSQNDDSANILQDEQAEKSSYLNDGNVLTYTVNTPVEEVETILNSSQVLGMKAGYYLVSNVFAKNYYFKRFMNNSQEAGHDPKFFKNKVNDWNYVYYAFDTNYQGIKQLRDNELNGTYRGDMWILKIE